MIRTIFYNDAEKNIRAGWRMTIFLAAVSVMTALFSLPLRILKGHLHFIPQFIIGEAVFYGALLLTTWLIAKYLERRPSFASFGFPINGNVFRELGQGLLIGAGMMTVIFFVEMSLGMVAFTFKPLTVFKASELVGASVIMFTIGAAGEELLFRGYLFQTMVEGTGKIIAVVAFALFFGYAHHSNPNVTLFSLVNVGLAGVWLSIAYFKTRTLWFPIALHFSWNYMQNNVFSFPVSGLQLGKYQLGVLSQSGPVWLTGGTFGPEGGMLATVMLVVSGIFIYWSPWVAMSDNVWTLERWKESLASTELTEQTAVTTDASSSSSGTTLS